MTQVNCTYNRLQDGLIEHLNESKQCHMGKVQPKQTC